MYTSNQPFYRLIPCFFIVLLFLWSCEPFADRPEEQILARVGDESLTIQEALNTIPPSVLGQDTLTALRNFQNEWVENKLLEQEARRLGVDRNQDFLNRLDRHRSQMLQNELRTTILNRHHPDLEVTRDEAQDFYQANRDRFVLDEKYVRFRHLTARSRPEAEQAKQALMAGRSWEEVTNRFSIYPNRQKSEAEQFIPISMAVPDNPVLNRYLNLIGIHEISPIEQSGGHFHFVQKLEERAEGEHPDLDWLIDHIVDWLYLERSQRLINSYKRNLYLQAEANNEIDKTDVDEVEMSNFQHHLNSNE